MKRLALLPAVLFLLACSSASSEATIIDSQIPPTDCGEPRQVIHAPKGWRTHGVDYWVEQHPNAFLISHQKIVGSRAWLITFCEIH